MECYQLGDQYLLIPNSILFSCHEKQEGAKEIYFLFFSVSQDGRVDNQTRKRRQRGGDVHFAHQRRATAAAGATWKTGGAKRPSDQNASSASFHFSQNQNPPAGAPETKQEGQNENCSLSFHSLGAMAS